MPSSNSKKTYTKVDTTTTTTNNIHIGTGRHRPNSSSVTAAASATAAPANVTGPVRRRSSALVSAAVSAAATVNNAIEHISDEFQLQDVVTELTSSSKRRHHHGAGGEGFLQKVRGMRYERIDSADHTIKNFTIDDYDDEYDDDADDEAEITATPPFKFRQRQGRDSIMTMNDSGNDGRRDSNNAVPPYTTTESITQPHTPRPITFGDYFSVLYRYPMYRAYLLSHLCQHTGNWFVRIASILIVEELAEPVHKGEVLSVMTLCRLLPNAVFAQVGGVLADQLDRRNLMIILDVMAGFVVLGYLLAIQQHSLPLFYGVTILRSACDATYFPVTVGIVPLLVSEPRDLQCAVTMNGWAWSIMAILGGVIAGSLAASIGLNTCYLIDFGTFWLSAFVLYFGVHGNFKVKTTSVVQQTSGLATTEQSDGLPTDSALVRKVKNTFRAYKELSVYLVTCGFGLMVFLKSSASFIWGIEDIVLPEFATVFNEDGTEDEELSSMRMGEAFSVVGLGCLVGPTLVNLITDAHRPHTLQRACLIGVGFLTSGWLIISTTRTFPQFLAGTLWRVMGSGIVWVNSTLVLQTLVDPEILGRVLGLEFTLTQLFEASSAAVSGKLDDAGFSKSQLTLFGALLGVVMLVFWGTYYALSFGAAQPRFNNNYDFDDPHKTKDHGVKLDDLEIEMMDAATFDAEDEGPVSKRSQKVIVRL
jgi:MFS family permease